jgi:alpha-glucosidase
MRKNGMALLLFLVFTVGRAPADIQVTSPGGVLSITFRLTSQGMPLWRVHGPGGELLSWSPLGLTLLEGGPLISRFTLVDSAFSERDEAYELVVGKTKNARDHSRELRVELREAVKPHRRLMLDFRAYDDGVAFRYILPGQESLSQINIVRENTEFHFPHDLKCWAFQINTFRSSFEGQYLPTMLGDLPDTGLVCPPLTMQRPDGVTLAITEADLVDYAGMYLCGRPGAAVGVALPPRPDGSGVCVTGRSPFSSPWRVMLIGKRPVDLIGSTIIQNLSAPCVLEDVSWITPGKVLFPWWPNFFADKPGVESKLNFENQKYYIDFASENNIAYLEMEPPWYGEEGDCIRNPGKYDITRPIPELKLPELFEYARERKVGLLLWAHWENVDRQADTAFALYEQWGAAGVKIDFMNRDDQDMVRWYQRILKKAAAHHLMVYFHGAYKPTGTQRTYPHLLTLEGVLGNEQNKVTRLVTPEHTVTIPYTRMLAGPMDFTPGGFRNVTAEEFTPEYNRPAVMGTRCHQLAMYVVYESPFTMVCDDPAAYRGQPGLEFIRDVPTSWDRTTVIDGRIGEYVVLARKRGEDWYLGAMTDWSAREMRIPLTFLGKGRYQAWIFQDGAGADRHPVDLDSTTRPVTRESTIAVRLAKGGGLAVRFRKR